MTGDSPQRVLEIDAMRGIAALAVAVFHCTNHYGNEIGHIEPPIFGFPAGNYGVQLFFLISGFVIFMTLERTTRAADFVVSRFSRLFPAYWAAIALTATVVYTIGMPQQKLAGWDLALNLTMVQQILGGEHLDGSYWTLQVELFFYVQMLFLYSTRLLHRIHWIIVGWLLLSLASGLWERVTGHPISYTLREVLILRHIPFFAIGILFYRIWMRSAHPRIDYLLILASLAVIALTLPPVYLPVAAFCVGAFWLFVTGRLLWLRLAPFVFLGKISYSEYLLHQAIGFAIIWHLETAGFSGTASALAAIIATALLATLLTFLIERPAMRAIRSAWKRRSAAATAA
ncbi:MAG: acyltransferase family protein [Burkholderiales bacterium]